MSGTDIRGLSFSRPSVPAVTQLRSRYASDRAQDGFRLPFLIQDALRPGASATVQDHSYEQLVLPVYYLNAIEKSYETGVTQAIPKVEL